MPTMCVVSIILSLKKSKIPRKLLEYMINICVTTPPIVIYYMNRHDLTQEMP